jgi:hypothetical protein
MKFFPPSPSGPAKNKKKRSKNGPKVNRKRQYKLLTDVEPEINVTVYIFHMTDGDKRQLSISRHLGQYVTLLQSSCDSRISAIRNHDYVPNLTGASNVPKIEQCQDFDTGNS